MKNFIVILLLLAVFQCFGQKKKKVDQKDVLIDSLTKTNSDLLVQVDSISKDQQVYYGLYTTLKEKVLLHDFDPARFPEIVDSVRASRDSTTSVLRTSLQDSLDLVTRENNMLKAKLDSMNVQAANYADKTKLVAELKDLKTLLDSKVITQAEFDEKKKLVMDKWQ